MRPLGMPCWSDKLLQEVIRSIMESYYEPQFSDCPAYTISDWLLLIR